MRVDKLGTSVAEGARCDLPGCDQLRLPKKPRGSQSRYCSRVHQQRHTQQVHRRRAKEAAPCMLPSICKEPGCTNPPRSPDFRGSPARTLYCDEHATPEARAARQGEATNRYRVRQRTKRCPGSDGEGCNTLIYPDDFACLAHSREINLAMGRDGAAYREKLESEIRQEFSFRGEPAPSPDELRRLVGARKIHYAQARWSSDPEERRRQRDEWTREQRASGRAQAWYLGRKPRLWLTRLQAYSPANPDDDAASDGLRKLEAALVDDQPRRGHPAVKTVLAELEAADIEDLCEPGVHHDQSGQSWHGFDPTAKRVHWRFAIQTLERFDAKGQICWPKHGTPYKRSSVMERVNRWTLDQLDRHGARGLRVASLEHWFASTWHQVSRGTVPSVQNLIRRPVTGGRPAKQQVPNDFRSPWGMVVLAAVVYVLLQRGQTRGAVAARFGWNAYHQGGRWFSPLATTFAIMARKVLLKRNTEGKRRFTAEWQRALAEAHQYLTAHTEEAHP